MEKYQSPKYTCVEYDRYNSIFLLHDTWGLDFIRGAFPEISLQAKRTAKSCVGETDLFLCECFP